MPAATDVDVKTLYAHLLEAANARDLAAAEQLMAPNAVNHTPAPGEPPGNSFLDRRSAEDTRLPERDENGPVGLLDEVGDSAVDTIRKIPGLGGIGR